jgi:hypothetical protein
MQKESPMKSEKRKFEIEFITPMLGTVPKDEGVYTAHVLAKTDELMETKKAEEAATVESIEEKGWTGFHKDDDGIFIYDYMIRGHIKSGLEACMKNGELKKITAYKKWVDMMVFVWPRRLRFDGKSEPDGVLERPLRAMTAQGPRVSVVRSDIVNEGTRLAFEIELLKQNSTNKSDGVTWDAIEKALAYGKYYGLGQWRGSGGYGRFVVAQ